jgi:hypothetical protein
MGKQEKNSNAKHNEQVAEFKKAARALDCDQSEAAFDRAPGKIGRAKAAAAPATKKRKRP